jgi:pSer/pThr/pTyr-binding forkhead associated (FHA) protein
MQREHEVVRLAARYQEIWHRFFPGLFRRAQWHIIRYLCTTGREGGAVGEISGLVRQIFLLDEATVRERLVSLAGDDLCRVEPSQGNMYARSIVFPTEALLRRFDEHLLALADAFAASVAAIEPGARSPTLARIDAPARSALLRVIDSFCEPWREANDRVLAARDLSQARRHEAKRHLIAPSHWIVVLMATRHHYETPQQTGGNGVLADRMAANLIDLIGQNFQTTRDHINYLMEIGLLERRSGKALYVALTPLAARMLHEALGKTAAQWPALLRHINEAGDDADAIKIERPAGAADDRTINLSANGTATVGEHHLRIVKPRAARRHIPIAFIPLTIGRSAPADLVLEGAEISRAHCRIDITDGQISVTDLKSTNGTYVDGQRISGTVPLQRGAVIEIGSYVIEYEHHRPEKATNLAKPKRAAAGQQKNP